MKKIIGFATQFYTLWNYEVQPVYITDSYGNHHQSGVKHIYTYIKNISKDLQVVKKQYPNVSIDETLRGKTASFSSYQKIDLPEGYFWFGKYYGKKIDEVIETDFNYCLWASDKVAYIKTTTKYIQYFENKRKQEETLIQSVNLPKKGDKIKLLFTTNGYNPMWTDNGRINPIYTKEEEAQQHGFDSCFVDVDFGESVDMVVVCSGVKQIGGLYPYLMPIINGKAQRTRGKKIMVEVIEILNYKVYDNTIHTTIKIK